MSTRWIEGYAAILALLSLVVVLRPRLLLAGVVAVLAAAWWPLNNRVLEGATLISVTPHHGLTVNDLLGVLGFACTAIAIVRAPDNHRAKMIGAVAAVFVLACGMAAAFATGG